LGVGVQILSEEVRPDRHIVIDEHQQLSSRGRGPDITGRRPLTPAQPNETNLWPTNESRDLHRRFRPVINDHNLVVWNRQVLGTEPGKRLG
jgi:hypothetical protein